MSGLTRLLTAAAAVAALIAGCASPFRQTAADTWRPDSAAVYLDRRAEWRMGWRDAARDRGTFCVSCHTTLPYALAYPALRERVGQARTSAREEALLDNVRTRVRHWADVSPYYGGRAAQSAKAVESRATEAVLNALILADADARSGRVSAEMRLAFEHMWALQQSDGADAGAWPWLRFGLEPWEGDHGDYYGAVLAALATGTAPEAYASNAAIQPNIARLRSYLDRRFQAQPLSNRALVLWASARLPGLLSDDRRARLITDLRRAQRLDGGWSLKTLSGGDRWWDPRRLTLASDGYATGLAVLALDRATGNDDAHVRRGLAWLATHQNATDGSWPGYSLNRLEPPSAEVGRFMNDAATAYAALALVEASPQVR